MNGIRYNLILVGLIQGSKEVKGDNNFCIAPFVNELRELDNGVRMNLPDGSDRVIRAAILALCCDVPGLRKLLQWGSHAFNM